MAAAMPGGETLLLWDGFRLVRSLSWTEDAGGPVTSQLIKAYRLMNHQPISEISFEETYIVPAEQTARSLFTRLPHGHAFAGSLVDCLATGYLIAVIESVCMREMQRHIDPAVEVVVGRSIHVEHRGPSPAGATIRLSGWVEGLGRHSATFGIRASDSHELVCEGTVTLVAADRSKMEHRIEAKKRGWPKDGSAQPPG